MVLSCATIIDECLPSMTEAELQDIIRVSRRLAESKVQEARNGKRQWRFWDKPLELDWSAVGIPAIQYPRGRVQEPEIDVFDLLKGSATPPISSLEWKIFDLLAPKATKHFEGVDWDLLELLDPAKDRTLEIAEPEEEPTNFLAIDWSGDRLPHVKNTGPPMRRPGYAGRVRAGSYHKPIKPQPHKSPKSSPKAEDILDVAKLKRMLIASKQFPEPAKYTALRQNPTSMNRQQRATARIQQPCGGGR